MLLLLFLLLPFVTFSQEVSKQNFEISFSGGIAFENYSLDPETNTVNLYFPKFGSLVGINFDYMFAENRFIGLGLSRQQFSKTINDAVFAENYNSGLVLDNYKNINQKTYFDVHFRVVFKKNMDISIGAFYYNGAFNYSSVVRDGSKLLYVIEGARDNLDGYFGLFGSFEYFFNVASYVDLGLNSKIFMTLYGIETIAILPTIRIKI